MKKLWLFFIVLITCTSTKSQNWPIDYNPYVRFGHLTVSDGLPGNHVTVIRQDNEGFMWIGTREGLARYDGTRFRVFQHKNGDSTSIASDYINDILIAPDNTLYVGTKRGLSIYHPETFRFRQVPVLFEEGHGLHDVHIRALLYEDENHIWVETFNGILHLMNTRTFKARTWAHDKPSQPYYDYHSILKDSRGNLWIGGRNMGPLKMKDEIISPVETSSSDPSLKREKDVAFFFEDKDHDFWIGGLDGLYQFDRDRETVKKRMRTSSYAMTESVDGYLWIATGRGLARIDKKNKIITSYVSADNTPSSIIHDNTNCVTIDRNGNIWTGTDHGISIINTTHNLIRHYRHISNVPGTLSNNHVSSFLEDRKGQIWIGTRGGGLNRFLPGKNQFEAILTSGNTRTGISSDQVSALFEDQEGIIWTGLWQGVGFNRFNPDNQEFTHYALDSVTFKRDWYSGFETLGEDTLVVGFWGAEGIRLFDKKKEQWLPHSFQPLDHPADAPLYHLAFGDSLLWFYRRGNSVSSFHPSTHQFKTFRSRKRKKQNQRKQIESVDLPLFSKMHDIITLDHWTLFLTNKGTVAFNARNKSFTRLSAIPYRLATPSFNNQSLYLLGEKGISRFNMREGKIRSHIPISQIPAEGKDVNDMICLSEKTLLLATSSGLITINSNNGKSPKLERYSGNITQKVSQIEKGPHSSLIFILNRGFVILQPGQEAIVYNIENAFDKGLRNDLIHTAISDRQNNGLWLGTDRGLYFFSPEEQIFQEIPDLNELTINDIAFSGHQYYLSTNRGLATMGKNSRKVTFFNHPPDDMLSSHLVTFIQKDSKGFIWAGTTDKGLNRINPNTLKVTHYLPGEHFHGSEVQAFFEASDGTIYAGGDSLNILHPGSESFGIAPFSDQLPQGKILSLQEDHLGRLLITSAHNITIYSPAEKRLFDLTPYLGIENITFTTGSLKSSTNELYLGTVKGFLQIDPSLLEKPSGKKQTRVTGVRIMGESPENPLALKKGIELSHDQNYIQFFFSDMVYPPARDKYRYKLEGIDHEWILTSEASATYKMIPPGEYRFKVKTINPFGGTTASQIPVNIRPPFWKTWWFPTFVLLLTAGGIWYWWQHRLVHLQVLEKNLQLRHRLLLARMNPHFIFNALSAIQAFMLQNQPQKAGGYLSKFAKLMRLNLNNMASPVTSISDEKEILNHYLELQCLRYNNSFQYSVTIQNGIDAFNLGIPTMMVQPFVENAVEHGMRNIEYNGKIEVVFTLKNQSWHVMVRDNGIGIEQSKNINNFSHKSMGLNITRARVHQMEKEYKQPCYITIKDRTQESGSYTGTIVNIVVPAIQMN